MSDWPQTRIGTAARTLTPPARNKAAETVWFSRDWSPPPWARATRMLTEAPMAPKVRTRIIVRLLANPTAAIAVAPSVPTTIWLTRLRTRVRTNSALTGTAMRAISRRGDGAARPPVGAWGDKAGLSGYWLTSG